MLQGGSPPVSLPAVSSKAKQSDSTAEASGLPALRTKKEKRLEGLGLSTKAVTVSEVGLRNAETVAPEACSALHAKAMRNHNLGAATPGRDHLDAKARVEDLYRRL